MIAAYVVHSSALAQTCARPEHVCSKALYRDVWSAVRAHLRCALQWGHVTACALVHLTTRALFVAVISATGGARLGGLPSRPIFPFEDEPVRLPLVSPSTTRNGTTEVHR
jgi:hypothetical protein